MMLTILLLNSTMLIANTTVLLFSSSYLLRQIKGDKND